MQSRMPKILLSCFLLLCLLGVIRDVIDSRQLNAQINGVVTSGQQAVTGTAAAITGIGAGTVCVKALAGNSIAVYLGGAGVTDATGMELSAGNAYCAPTARATQFYVIASTTGASVSWIVTN